MLISKIKENHMSCPSVQSRKILRMRDDCIHHLSDLIVTEEPLEIVVFTACKTKQVTIATTMRTPGHDFELALGILYNERVIFSKEDILHIYHCPHAHPQESRIHVVLQPYIPLPENKRISVATSSCGLCGDVELVHTHTSSAITTNRFEVSSALIKELPRYLRENQTLFEHTGGIHASALASEEGQIHYVREDIGRHNAMDKVIGACLFENSKLLPVSLMITSSRIGYELVLKVVRAHIPMLVAIGAPSHLSIQLAEEAGITLIGFAKFTGFNIYTHPHRVHTHTDTKI